MAGVLRVPGDRKSPAIQAVWGMVKNRSAVSSDSSFWLESLGECCLLKEKSESEQGRTRTFAGHGRFGRVRENSVGK